tara:strand:+ start:1329 stop:3725 length:2397 start_codon:yes stop_codon:yes gene_type:complete
MAGSYEHLKITPEQLRNNRRTQPARIPRQQHADIRAHGQRLSEGLNTAVRQASSQATSATPGCILKLSFVGALDFENLQKHGVEFISQEDKQLCVAFADERGIEIFSDHLQKLGLDGTDLTYKQILEALDGIDNWTSGDRKSWALNHVGLPTEDPTLLDIELWPIKYQGHPERTALRQSFENWLNDFSVVLIDHIDRDSLLMYRVRATHEQAALLLNHRDVRMVDLPPKSGIHPKLLMRDINELPGDIPSPKDDASKICILDSGISTNHPLLKSAIAESKSFIPGQDESDDVGHGTAVAGVALYGDMEACNEANYWQPQSWIYNGKILFKDQNGDAVFNEGSIEKTLIEAVEYFVELGCRIFNLSIGNAGAPYDGTHVGGMAYTLDALARQYDVLFVVSTGNFGGSNDPQVPAESWRSEYPDYLISTANPIIDPAPALNVLTVGSIAKHTATIDAQRYPEINQLTPASGNQPSPFTRHGPSARGALKPDLVAIGGNLASPMRDEGREWHKDTRGLGVLTCHHQPVERAIFAEDSGTSFSAPYISHLAGRLLNEYPNASANLLRALLVNHANLPDETRTVFTQEAIKAYAKATNSYNRELPREIAGYGAVSDDILYRSTDEAVVLMSEDSIENDNHIFYELPLPDDFLRSKRAVRELRVTLAYTPSVRTTRIDYKATRIKYNLIKASSLDEAQAYFNRETQDETGRIGDAQTPNRSISSELRSKGTVQSSIWTLKQLNTAKKWFVVVTRQDYEWGKAISDQYEKFALVVTVTDRENEQANLYVQIAEQIQQKEQVQVRL